MTAGRKRVMKFRSTETELPASGDLPAPGAYLLRYSKIWISACDSETPSGISVISPELVCISRTKSFIWSIASWGAWITRSTPSPRMLSCESVIKTAISTNTSLLRSNPVISQSTQIRFGDSLLIVKPYGTMGRRVDFTFRSPSGHLGSIHCHLKGSIIPS